MNHQVTSVEDLYQAAEELNQYVSGSSNESADGIIRTIRSAIDNLKTNWKGKDAAVQINNVVGVYNAMVKIKNALGELVRASSKVAVNYRDIQIANKSGQSSLTEIDPGADETPMEDHVDNSDTIYIVPEAAGASENMGTASSQLSSFVSRVEAAKEKVMSIWLVGTGREVAEEAFRNFSSSVKGYIETLNEVKTSVDTALGNYE